MEQTTPLITLTTDFGLTDPYVGQLKGALLTGCPTATLIDLTHSVPAWDLLGAAIVLHSSYAYFPPATVHLVVVDPGVGSDRAIVAARGKGHFFVCPDNGILSLLIEEEAIDTVRVIKPLALGAGAISATFHGRDLMAPVVAALAQGKPIRHLGDELASVHLQRLAPWRPIRTDQGWQGRVLGIDRFGNLRTSIRAPELRGFQALVINGQRLERMVSTYSEIPGGTLAVLIDSCGFVEIAANQASAADCIGGVVGNGVTVHCVHSPHYI